MTLHRVARVGSTMDLLHQLAAEGAPAGTVVVADEQTGGRGSRGRAWISPPGGLWLSVLFRPSSRAGTDLLSLRVGLAVAEALESLDPGLRVRLKWPNDLMLGDQKLGGILCEARWQGETLSWIVAGVGLNVANPPPDPRATTLNLWLQSAAPESVLAPVIERLRRIEGGSGGFDAVEQARIGARDWLRGRRLRAPIGGTAAGIAADGALLVESGAGEPVSVRAGSVELAEDTSTP